MVGQSARIRGLPFAENLFSLTRSAGRIRWTKNTSTKQQGKEAYHAVQADYSEDGYGVHEPVIYETNYDVAAIAEGYKKSCKKYGIQFNRGDNDFTGLGLKCWDKRALWSNPSMGANWLDEKMHDLLTHTGVVPEEDMMPSLLSEGKYLANYDSESDEYANAIMRFIALSMPDDFTYKIQEPENIPCLNDTLGVNLGYGLLVP